MPWSLPTSEAAPLRYIPVTVEQPDGEIINIFASGDEFINWYHDKDGFIITQDPVSGYYVYAEDDNGGVVPTHHEVGTVSPEKVSAKSGVPFSPEKIQEKQLTPQDLFPAESPDASPEIGNAPQTGTINNLVVFIRFSDDPAFTQNISQYQSMFNSTSSGANSMRNYFTEVSYNQLAVSSSFYPTTSGTVLSYQDSHTRGYYQPYNAATNPTGYTGGNNGTERTTREHTLLHNAINSVSTQVTATGLNLDGDDDGYVDNVCFIVKGAPTGWSSLLWPHKWDLYTYNVTINGDRVYTYNFQLESSLASSGVGVLCHEMFHSLGAPDLYHYTNNGINPIWKWDLMEYNLNPPQHMSSYMKMRYGSWISSIPEITTSGTYTLNPLTSSTNNAYRIASPNSLAEYFIVEYRRTTGTFEASLPGSGLLVYRVNTAADGLGNRNGPPDELYTYRPGGTTSVDGTPDNAYCNSSVSRTVINDSTNPSSFLSSGANAWSESDFVFKQNSKSGFTPSLVPPSRTLAV